MALRSAELRSQAAAAAGHNGLPERSPARSLERIERTAREPQHTNGKVSRHGGHVREQAAGAY